MSDRPSQSPSEAAARNALVAIALAMLEGTLPFNEGAFQVRRLRHQVGGVAEWDKDFDVFVAIESETDHLPLRGQFHLWQQEGLQRLAPEFERTQKWASQFGRAACASLVERFKA